MARVVQLRRSTWRDTRVSPVKLLGGAIQDALSGTLIDSMPGPVQEQGAGVALADTGQDSGLGRPGQYRFGGSPTVTRETRHREQALVVEVLDIESGGFTDTQSVEGEHAAQPVGVDRDRFGTGQQVVDLTAGECSSG
jgi:hypothetical protein